MGSVVPTMPILWAWFPMGLGWQNRIVLLRTATRSTPSQRQGRTSLQISSEIYLHDGKEEAEACGDGGRCREGLHGSHDVLLGVEKG
jgi:hypothetical protein